MFGIPTATDSRIFEIDFLVDWLRTPTESPMGYDEVVQYFHLLHPRISFVKCLPTNTVLFDIGAGDGALLNSREWPGFKRRDLRFVGASLEHGKYTQQYSEFFIGNLDVEKPNFVLAPQHAVLAQFIEHLQDPFEFLQWLGAYLPSGGRLFIDWPSEHTVKLPSRAELAKFGFDSTTLNFYDDSTHKTAYSIKQIVDALVKDGFRITSTGMVDMPFLADSLKHYGLSKNEQYLTSMALWLKTNFISYVSAVKI